MNITPNASVIFILCFLAAPALASEFLKDEEPGHRGSFGDPNTKWTPELDDYTNCSLREYLKIGFVEACAIFKENGRRYLECRYYPGTYENVPSAEITKQQEAIVNICGPETLSNTKAGGAFSNFWSKLFGE